MPAIRTAAHRLYEGMGFTRLSWTRDLADGNRQR